MEIAPTPQVRTPGIAVRPTTATAQTPTRPQPDTREATARAAVSSAAPPRPAPEPMTLPKSNTAVEVNWHAKAHRFVVKVMDEATGRPLTQLPLEQILDMVAELLETEEPSVAR